MTIIWWAGILSKNSNRTYSYLFLCLRQIYLSDDPLLLAIAGGRHVVFLVLRKVVPVLQVILDK